MQNLKISLVTVAYDAQNTIKRCIEPVVTHKFNNIQHTIIHGGSDHGTIRTTGKYRDNISVSAAGYELMLPLMPANKAKVFYINKIMVKMVSNKSLSNRVKALVYDLKAMRKKDILFPYVTIIFKPIRKIVQFF